MTTTNQNMPTVAQAKIESKTCNECHWLLTKYKGKSCSDKGLTALSPACESFQEVQATINEIKNDPTIQQINQQTVTELVPQFDESLIDEVRTYLTFSIKVGDKEVRPVPATFNTPAEWEVLQQINEQCQAYRDRVLDVQFSFVKIRQRLDTLWQQAEAHIVSRYQSTLAVYKDISQRTAVIGDILAPLSQLYSKIKDLATKCEQTTANLTSASHSLREIKDIAMHIYSMKHQDKRSI